MVPRDGGRAGELLSNRYEFQFHKMKKVLNNDDRGRFHNPVGKC